MSGEIEKRLAALGLTLPKPLAPVANYVPWTRSANTLWIAGQIPVIDGKPLATGLVGGGVSLEQAQECARMCALLVLAQAKAAVGDLDHIAHVLKVTGFVATAAGFDGIPKVVNGASDLFVSVLGDSGKHARSSVGVAALPLNVPVEVEAVIELR